MTERKIIFLGFAIMLMHTVDFMLVVPVSPYFVHQLHIPVSLIGTIVGVYTLSAAISSIIFSRFVDAIPRKKAIIIVLVGLGLATALTALAWNTSSLLCFRILAGLFGGPASALATTIITDGIPVQRRGKAMGLLMSAFSISSAVAIPLATFIATHVDWRVAFIVVAGLIALLIIFVITACQQLPQQLAKDNQVSSQALLRNKAVWYAFLMLAVSMGTLFAIIPNLVNFFVMNRGLSLENIGYVYFIGGVASVIGGVGGGKLVDKIGPIQVCAIGTVCAVCGLLLQINFDIISIAAFFALMMGGASMRMSSVMTQMSEIPAPQQRGAFMSLQNSVRNLVITLGSSFSGLFLTTVNGKMQGMETLSIIAVIGTLAVPVMMLYIAAYLKQRGQPQNT